MISQSLSPEESASFASRLIYHWFNGLAWKGYKKPLELSDLWDLNTEDKSRQIVPKFDAYWEESKKRNRTFVSDDKSEIRGVDLKRPRKSTASILPALVRSFGATFFFGAVLKAVQDCLGFVSPQILRWFEMETIQLAWRKKWPNLGGLNLNYCSLLIAFVNNPDEENWKGYLYAFVLTATAVAQTIFVNQYLHRMFIVGLQVRTAIVSTVYRKVSHLRPQQNIKQNTDMTNSPVQQAIRISNGARKESTVGEIVNLMAVDAQRLTDLTNYLNMIWSAPLQIALAVYFLYQILGASIYFYIQSLFQSLTES